MPVHLKDLTDEERKLVISNIKNFIEKLKPDNSFDKFKVRVLFRGDLQREIGQSEGPVCRIESLKTIMSIAAFEDYEVFTIDIIGAYLNTPMPEDVKHKWMKLDKDVVAMLLESDRERYKEYVRAEQWWCIMKSLCMAIKRRHTIGIMRLPGYSVVMALKVV
jgi:hypothetical protein